MRAGCLVGSPRPLGPFPLTLALSHGGERGLLLVVLVFSVDGGRWLFGWCGAPCHSEYNEESPLSLDGRGSG